MGDYRFKLGLVEFEAKNIVHSEAETLIAKLCANSVERLAKFTEDCHTENRADIQETYEKCKALLDKAHKDGLKLIEVADQMVEEKLKRLE